MKRSVMIAFVLGLALGCAQPTAERTIVASTSIVADWVENVAGPDWTVVSLVGRDGDSHTYEPTPADVQTLAQARLIVLIGAGLEHDWMQPLLESSGTTAPVLVLSEHTQLLRRPGHDIHDEDHDVEDEDHDEHDDHDEHAEGQHDHHHGEYDPHVWQSPRRVKDLVLAIMNKLISLDAANAQGYRQRANDYIQKLDELDRDLQALLAPIPRERRKLVLLHRAFGYFAADYGFEQTASILNSLTTQARDPSAADVARLVDLLKKERIPAIFDENLAANPVTAAIARDAGVKLAPALYSDALGQKGTPGESYLSMMRANARTILEALR